MTTTPSPSPSPNPESPPTTSYIFVYGTLRRAYSTLTHPSITFRPPEALNNFGTFVTSARLPNFVMYDLGQYPGIFPTSDPQTTILGDIYKITEPLAETLKILDSYEGITPQAKHPTEYRREVVRVLAEESAGKKKKECWVWVYVYNWDWKRGEGVMVEGGDYVEYLRKRLLST